jgi:tetratricopeptide (TPR) repeat protein
MDKEPYKPGLSRDSRLVTQLEELEKNPNSLIFASLAERFRQNGLIRQAIEIIDEGLERHPDFGTALVVKARCLFDLRRFADCLALLDRVLKQNPENIKAEKLRFDLYLRLGQKMAAQASIGRVLKLAPTDKDAIKKRSELGLAFSLDKSKVSQATDHNDNTPLKKIDSHEHGELKDFQVLEHESSRNVLPAAVESVPTLSSDQLAEGWSEEDEAAADSQESPFQGATFATRTVAELYLRQGLKVKAIKILEAMLLKEPNDSWARETLKKLSPSNDNNEIKPVRRTELMLKAQRLERLLVRVQSLKRLA